MLLKNKTALITGGSRGIGRAIAICFAEQGCNIAFTYHSNREAAEEVLDQLRAYGVQAEAYQQDAACADGAEDVVRRVVEQYGQIDILVNNAGITRDTLLMRMNEQQWDDVLQANLKSAYAYTKAVVPVMMKRRQGSIISMSSVVAITGNPGQANYAASKAGLIAFSKSVAKEIGSRGIRVNCIAPGFIQTDMTEKLTEEQKNAILAQIPMHRVGTPQDVAHAALFLASDLSSYISGQVLTVDGAMV